MTYRPSVGERVLIDPFSNEDSFVATITSIGDEDEVIGVERTDGKPTERKIYSIREIIHTDDPAKQEALSQDLREREEAEDEGWPEDHFDVMGDIDPDEEDDRTIEEEKWANRVARIAED